MLSGSGWLVPAIEKIVKGRFGAISRRSLASSGQIDLHCRQSRAYCGQPEDPRRIDRFAVQTANCDDRTWQSQKVPWIRV